MCTTFGSLKEDGSNTGSYDFARNQMGSVEKEAFYSDVA